MYTRAKKKTPCGETTTYIHSGRILAAGRVLTKKIYEQQLAKFPTRRQVRPINFLRSSLDLEMIYEIL